MYAQANQTKDVHFSLSGGNHDSFHWLLVCMESRLRHCVSQRHLSRPLFHSRDSDFHRPTFNGPRIERQLSVSHGGLALSPLHHRLQDFLGRQLSCKDSSDRRYPRTLHLLSGQRTLDGDYFTRRLDASMNPTWPNKTDAGNGSYGICRVSNVLRSPSPDPGRSPKK